MILHKHFTVNGRVVNVPSFLMRPGDVVAVRDKSKKMGIIHETLRRVKDENLVPWLRLDKAKLEGEFLEFPNREDIPIDVQESLIVELYSK